MFIRETVTRKVADKVYKSFRLVKGVRDSNKIRQVALLNLGSSFTVPKEHWPELGRIIKERLDGTLSMFEPDPELAVAAESILRRLRNQGLEAEDTSGGTTAEVVLDSIDCKDVRSAGCERLAHASLVTLGFLDILLYPKQKQAINPTLFRKEWDNISRIVPVIMTHIHATCTVESACQ